MKVTKSVLEAAHDYLWPHVAGEMRAISLDAYARLLESETSDHWAVQCAMCFECIELVKERPVDWDAIARRVMSLRTQWQALFLRTTCVEQSEEFQKWVGSETGGRALLRMIGYDVPAKGGGQ